MSVAPQPREAEVLRTIVRRALLTLAVLLATVSIGRAQDAPAAAPPDTAAVLAHGRAIQALIDKGDAAGLWAELSDRLKAGLGGTVERFGAILNGIGAQTGPRKQLLDETIGTKGEYVTYAARGKYEKSGDAVLVLDLSFDAAGHLGGIRVHPDAMTEFASPFLDYTTKATLLLPFLGEWKVVWGGRTLQQNYHAASRDQRFAYDLLKTEADSTHRGTGSRNEDYFCYLQPLVAPAAGEVVWRTDSLPDNVPGQTDRAHPVGNGVVLDLGNGEYALLAHMHPGSVRVKLHQKVKAGDPLGQCGNSGNTSEPHLHFHLQNGPTPLQGDGLPAQFVNYVADGKPVARGEPVQGQHIQRAK